MAGKLRAPAGGSYYRDGRLWGATPPRYKGEYMGGGERAPASMPFIERRTATMEGWWQGRFYETKIVRYGPGTSEAEMREAAADALAEQLPRGVSPVPPGLYSGKSNVPAEPSIGQEQFPHPEGEPIPEDEDEVERMPEKEKVYRSKNVKRDEVSSDEDIGGL